MSKEGERRAIEPPRMKVPQKRGNHWQPRNKEMSMKKKRKLGLLSRSEGTNDEVILKDVQELLARAKVSKSVNGHNVESTTFGTSALNALPPLFTEVELDIKSLSSSGEGIAYLADRTDHAVLIPFTLPNEHIVAKLVKHHPHAPYTQADLVRVLKPSPIRNDSFARCVYFGKCSGCQYQFLPYSEQLKIKRTVVEKAFKNFCDLPAIVVPRVDETVASPREYGYRTKLTPHFDGPPGSSGRAAKRQRGRGEPVKGFDEVPAIGFVEKGRSRILDIENCPIGSEVVQRGLVRERKRVADELDKFVNGATLLLRESTQRVTKESSEDTVASDEALDGKITIREDAGDGQHDYIKTCDTRPGAETSEYVAGYQFTFPASSFFQNNNSILGKVVDYIRERFVSPASNIDTTAGPEDNAQATKTDSTTNPPPSKEKPQITSLIDAYCGSGLFTITLSPHFSTAVGVDISAQSIASAQRNAALNGLVSSSSSPPSSSATESAKTRVHFTTSTASALFTTPDLLRNLVPAQTALIIDPPRKGCDDEFLTQVLAFGPSRIVYVSCNVHSQARDVEVLVRGRLADGKEEERAVEAEQATDQATGKQARDGEEYVYEIESIRPFDFFPQTAHVESVVVLNRIG